MSGRSTGASSITTVLRGSRSASAARTWLAVSGSPGPGGSGAAGARAERLLKDGGAELLDELDERRPRRRVVGSGADDERGSLGGGEEGGECGDRARVRPGRAQDRAAGGRGLALLVGGLSPVAHRDDHERRPAPCGRGVVGALDRGGHVVRGGRRLDRDRIRAREAVQAPGEEGLV